jgi:hypothetical protein
MPVGYAVVGPLSEAFGVSATLWGCAVVVAVSIAAQLASRDVRRLARPVPRFTDAPGTT